MLRELIPHFLHLSRALNHRATVVVTQTNALPNPDNVFRCEH